MLGQTRIGEVVAHQMTRTGLRLYVVTDAHAYFAAGSRALIGDGQWSGGQPVIVDSLAEGGRSIRSVIGPVKVVFSLPAEHGIVPNGTPVFV